MVSAKALLNAEKAKSADLVKNKVSSVPKKQTNQKHNSSQDKKNIENHENNENNKSETTNFKLVKVQQKKDANKKKGSKLELDTFSKALGKLDVIKRKREEISEKFGLDQKRQKHNDTPEPEYNEAFFASLFSRQPVQESRGGIIEKADIYNKLNDIETIYFDGDAIVSVFSKKIDSISIPILEYSIYFAINSWISEQNRKDKIVFRSSVLPECDILTSIPETLESNDAIVTISHASISSKLLNIVKVIKASDFLELNFELFKSTLSEIKNIENSILNAESKAMISIIKNNKKPQLQAREFMINIQDAIMIYDANNLIYKIGNLRNLPNTLLYWCIYQLVQLFGRKFNIKKTFFVMDYKPLSMLKKPFITTNEIEVIWEQNKKADEVIVDLCKKHSSSSNIVLVSDDEELSWRATNISICKVDSWRQAAVSVFQYKFQHPNDIIDKTIHDTLMWYLKEDKSISFGEWKFKKLELEEDRVWMTKSIKSFFEDRINKSNKSNKSESNIQNKDTKNNNETNEKNENKEPNVSIEATESSIESSKELSSKTKDEQRKDKREKKNNKNSKKKGK